MIQMNVHVHHEKYIMNRFTFMRGQESVINGARYLLCLLQKCCSLNRLHFKGSVVENASFVHVYWPRSWGY